MQRARGVRDKLLLICGADSTKLPVSIPGRALAEALGDCRMWEMPGGHLSFAARTHAASFCEKLLTVLQKEGRLALTKEWRVSRI